MENKTDKVIQFYQEESHSYDRKRFLSAKGKYLDSYQKNIVVGMVDSWSGKQILDVGCGTGRFSVELIRQGADVVSIDTSTEMLRRLNEKTGEDPVPGSPTLVCGGAYDLPFKDNEFDGCVCINVLNHLAGWGRVFTEIGRVIRPGGFFIMNFANMSSPYFPVALWVNLDHRSIVGRVYSRWDNPFNVRKELCRAHLIPQKIVGATMLPPFIPLRLTDFLIRRIIPLLNRSVLRLAAGSVFICNRVEKK
jgi:ubiquinone/menaquinone biosynthesis C-methylase UbiE